MIGNVFPRRNTLILSLVMMTGLSSHLRAQGMATIGGTVVAQDGTPIAAASLSYGPLAPPHGKAAAAMRAPIMQVSSAADGTFSIYNLNAGVYLVCVSTRNRPYLDPCHWSPSPPTFTVLDGQTISNAVIRLTKGQQYQIQINDPQQTFLKATTSPGAPLSMAIRSYSGATHTAILQSSNATSWTYAITIPFDTPIGLSVLPGAFQLLDSTGLHLASTGGQYQITAPSSGPIASLSFTLAGLAVP